MGLSGDGGKATEPQTCIFSAGNNSGYTGPETAAQACLPGKPGARGHRGQRSPGPGEPGGGGGSLTSTLTVQLMRFSLLSSCMMVL